MVRKACLASHGAITADFARWDGRNNLVNSLSEFWIHGAIASSDKLQATRENGKNKRAAAKACPFI
jgi:hypothetical protein